MVVGEGFKPSLTANLVLLGGFEPPTLPNLGTVAGYKPGVLPLNYRSKFWAVDSVTRTTAKTLVSV